VRYIAFVFWVDEINEAYPRGGWFDFVGVRPTLESARECVEDKWEHGDHYQIVDLSIHKVVEEGENSSTGSRTFAQRDRDEKAQEQARVLRGIGWKATAPRSSVMPNKFQYGPYELRRDL
jgi:hypothetical protein